MKDNLAYEIDEEIMKPQEPINFSPEERARIDRLLEEGEEYQKAHGNKTYTLDEVMGEIMEQYYKDIQNYTR